MKKEKKLIEKVVDELKGMKEVKAVFLFGSYAKRKQLPFSDIDISVITEKINQKIKSEITSLSSEKLNVCFFWDLPVYIRYRILKEGKLLFEGDEEFLHKVKFNTIREYIDFKPVIKRFAKHYQIKI